MDLPVIELISSQLEIRFSCTKETHKAQMSGRRGDKYLWVFSIELALSHFSGAKNLLLDLKKKCVHVMDIKYKIQFHIFHFVHYNSPVTIQTNECTLFD